MNDSLQSDMALLLGSGQFDIDWYVRRYPDVMQAGMSPIEHYLWLGKRIGRRGRPARADDELIDPQAFQAVDINALIHGRDQQERNSAHARVPTAPAAEREFADAAPVIDLEVKIQTLAAWPGLDKAYVCYQLRIGMDNDARRVAKLYYEAIQDRNILPNALFDPEYYRFINNISFREDSIFHYLTSNDRRNLKTHPLFDHDWYFKKYPDANMDPVVHYWENGFKDKITPVNPENIKIIDIVKDIFFSDIFDPSISDFEVSAYREMNPDLANFSDIDLKNHYENYGRNEKRPSSFTNFLKAAGLPGYCLPIDFDPRQYVSLHVDLEKDFSSNPWAALGHYVSGGLLEGRLYNFNQSTHLKSIGYNIDGDFDELSRGKTPICVLVHLYYPDMWDELRAYINNIDVDFDIYVNFVESTWMPATINQVREDFPHAKIKISPNEGRDIGGFFSLLKDINFSKYVAFTLLHSKKSPHVTRDYAAMWKKSLLGAILGSREMVRENVAAFLTDEEIGIIGSIRTRHVGLENNKEGMRRLFEIYGIDAENEECEYVSGTMMMVRSEVMKAVYMPLADHAFVNGDNKGLEHHMDGQIEHSVERIFGNVMRQLRYRFLWR